MNIEEIFENRVSKRKMASKPRLYDVAITINRNTKKQPL